MPEQKTKSERLKIVNETKLKCIEHDLTDDLATKILFTMLDNYYEKGTTYIGKELRLGRNQHILRKYVVNLYNEKKKTDVVLIRALTDEEVTESIRTRTRIATENQIPDVTHTWVRDPNSDSDSDEAPVLENVNSE